MTLETGVKALAEAVAVDVKALNTGKVNSNDPRLTDAREWSAATVTQAEAEAGTASTRRAWTAQRVWQAINAWYLTVSTTFTRTLLGRSTAAQVRDDLELGTAATRDVGESSGNVMQVGAFGLGGSPVRLNESFDLDNLTGTGFYQTGTTPVNAWPSASTNGGGLVFQMDRGASASQLGFNRTIDGFWFRRKSGSWLEVYHTGNTTKDPDGTLKASSPVINLYADHYDLHNESQFGATPAVTRKSKGVYEITGTLGLRSEGWYLDTPSDRNGNKYFNVEWTQNITPDAVDGIVDEYRDDIVVTIETFERVWNKETGMFDNGAPIDINELQDRFVQLRFNEIKVEHEELEDETITRDQE